MTTDVREVSLVPLTELDTETQMAVRDIRNEDGVRRWMYTDHVIGANEHLGWIARLKADDRQLVFAVLDAGGAALGVASVAKLDRANKTADWAFYLTETARGGLGSALEFAFIDFVFSRLGLEKLNCEVIEGNAPVLRLHTKFLFKEEGVRRSQVVKDGARLDAHLLGLTKADWEAGKAEVHARHKAALDTFSIAIAWESPDEREAHPIDDIERARAKNNLNWMSILRIALEKSPDVARPIVSDIKKLDREIQGLTGKLLGEDG